MNRSEFAALPMTGRQRELHDAIARRSREMADLYKAALLVLGNI